MRSSEQKDGTILVTGELLRKLRCAIVREQAEPINWQMPVDQEA
jgi:hypothetical protein